MNSRRFRHFYWFSCAGILAASFYPLYMGFYAVAHMLQKGAIPLENYPKYIIPYTPVALALIAGVFMLPVFNRLFKRFRFPAAAIFSTGVFFLAERLMETKILVQSQQLVQLESWQMSLCYIPPEMFQTRTWEAVNVLLGGYSPVFKLHFYLISVVIIVSLLNCFYGFAHMLLSGNHTRKKALILQGVTSIVFLGMCIWACFTSFYRTGEMTVSALSAVLMAVFFVLLGVTAGIFTGSFTLGRKRTLSVLLPAAAAVFVTLAMYMGEMVLLSGNLYRFGSGFFFDGIPYIILAPVDVILIVLSGGITAILFKWLNPRAADGRGKALIHRV